MKTATIEKIIETHAPRIDSSLEIRREEYESRWAKVQKAMAAKGYDLAYACGSELDGRTRPGWPASSTRSSNATES